MEYYRFFLQEIPFTVFSMIWSNKSFFQDMVDKELVAGIRGIYWSWSQMIWWRVESLMMLFNEPCLPPHTRHYVPVIRTRLWTVNNLCNLELVTLSDQVGLWWCLCLCVINEGTILPWQRWFQHNRSDFESLWSCWPCVLLSVNFLVAGSKIAMLCSCVIES